MFTMYGWLSNGKIESVRVDAWVDVLMMVDWLQPDMYVAVLVTFGAAATAPEVPVFATHETIR